MAGVCQFDRLCVISQWLLLFSNPLSVNRGWTGRLSCLKRWNLPSCRSSELRRTSVTLTRNSLASSQSSPSLERPASSLPSNKKSLRTLTSLSWVDQRDLPSVLLHHRDSQLLFIPTFICHKTRVIQQKLRAFSHTSTFPSADSFSYSDIQQNQPVTPFTHTLTHAGSDITIDRLLLVIFCLCQIDFELFNAVFIIKQNDQKVEHFLFTLYEMSQVQWGFAC